MISRNGKCGIYKAPHPYQYIIKNNTIRENVDYGISLSVGCDPLPDTISGNTIAKNNGAISFTGLFGYISHNTILEIFEVKVYWNKLTRRENTAKPQK